MPHGFNQPTLIIWHVFERRGLVTAGQIEEVLGHALPFSTSASAQFGSASARVGAPTKIQFMSAPQTALPHAGNAHPAASVGIMRSVRI